MSAAKQKRWRTITRRSDGVPVLRSPDGREWLGTAAEVREAELVPDRRKMLAECLHVEWITTAPGTAERRWLVAAQRREAIQGSATDVALGIGGGVTLPLALSIRAAAAARFHGMSLDKWLAGAAEAMIQAAADANGGSLPFTRHERAALGRIRRETQTTLDR